MVVLSPIQLKTTHLFGKTYLVEDKLDLSSGFMIVNELVDSSSREIEDEESEDGFESINEASITEQSRKKHILEEGDNEEDEPKTR